MGRCCLNLRSYVQLICTYKIIKSIQLKTYDLVQKSKYAKFILHKDCLEQSTYGIFLSKYHVDGFKGILIDTEHIQMAGKQY